MEKDLASRLQRIKEIEPNRIFAHPFASSTGYHLDLRIFRNQVLCGSVKTWGSKTTTGEHRVCQVALIWWFGLVVWKSGKSEFYAIYTIKYELLFAFCFGILNTYWF